MSASADVRRITWATAAARAGTWATLLVLAVVAWRESGPAAVGLIAAVRSLASAVGGPLCATLADHHRPQHLLLGASAMCGALVAAIAGAVGLGAGVATLCILIAVFGLVESIYDPAIGLLLVAITAGHDGRLEDATARGRVARHVGFLVGSVGGGFLLALGTISALLVAASMFAISLVPLAVLRCPMAGHLGDSSRVEISRGVRLVARSPELRAAIGSLGLLVAIDGAVDVLAVCAALGYLGGGDVGAGLLQGVVGVGALAAGALLLASGRSSARRVGIVGGCLFLSAALVAMTFVTWLGLALLVLGLAGLGYFVAEVTAGTLTYRLPPAPDVARVLGVLVTCNAITYAAGSALAGALAAAVGARSAFGVAGVAAFVATLALSVPLRRVRSPPPSLEVATAPS